MMTTLDPYPMECCLVCKKYTEFLLNKKPSSFFSTKIIPGMIFFSDKVRRSIRRHLFDNFCRVHKRVLGVLVFCEHIHNFIKYKGINSGQNYVPRSISNPKLSTRDKELIKSLITLRCFSG
jgi:hypothetical protein